MANDRLKASTMRRQPKQGRSQERVHQILDAAEEVFIALGYEQTTTRAIASRAEVPIGSLYQFFPDKAAIVRALADRYFEQEYRMFLQLHTELAEVEISTYVDRIIDAFEQFADERPGYRAVLRALLNQMTVTAASAMNEYDQLVLMGLTNFLSQRNPQLESAQCEMIATIVFKAANELLWLAMTCDSHQRSAVVAETKTLITAYLKTYQI